MNNEDEKLEQVMKELHVHDPYADEPDNIEDDFEEPIEVKLSDQTDGNLDKFFYIDDKEKKENFGLVRTLGICVVLFIFACIGMMMTIKEKKYVDIDKNGIKKEENWDNFVEKSTKKEKESDVIVRIYDQDGKVDSKIKIRYDGKYYYYGDEKEKYKYLLDEKGKLDDFGVNIRIIALANEMYTFKQLYNGLYKNAGTTFKNINLKELEDAVDSVNKLIDDIADIEGGTNTSAQLDELNDIKYKLVHCF